MFSCFIVQCLRDVSGIVVVMMLKKTDDCLRRPLGPVGCLTGHARRGDAVARYCSELLELRYLREVEVDESSAARLTERKAIVRKRWASIDDRETLPPDKRPKSWGCDGIYLSDYTPTSFAEQQREC